jgi:MFS family permease
VKLLAPHGPLARPGFRRFWTAQSISVLGDQVSLLALPLTAVLTLHLTAGEMGLLTAAGYAPHLVLSLLAGGLIDRSSRRRLIMVAADLGRALLLASIPLAVKLGALTPRHLYLAAFLVGTLTVLFDQCATSLLVLLTRPDELLAANGYLSTSLAGSQVAGPSLAGLLVGVVTAPVALLADAVSFLASARLLRAIKVEEPSVDSDGRPPTLRAIAEGVRFVFGDPMLRASAACTSTLNFFNLMLYAILVLFMSRTLQLAPATIGFVLGVGALGALLGAVVAPRLARAIGFGPAILAGAIAFPAPALLVPLAGGGPARAAAILTASEFLAGLGVMVYDVNDNTLRAVRVPYRLRGRAGGSNRFLTYGIRPLGALAGGWLGGTIGLRPTLWIAAVGGLLGVAWLWPSPIRGLRAPPAATDEGRTY